jgi:hypothetical protein
MVRVVPVIAEVAADEDSQQVGGGHARGRMPGTGRGAGADGVNAQLLSEVGREREVDVGGGGCEVGGGHEFLLDDAVSKYERYEAEAFLPPAGEREPPGSCRRYRQGIPRSFRINLRA